MIPGLMLTLMFMFYIGVRAIWGRAAPREAPGSGPGVLLALADIVPFALLICGIMGSIGAPSTLI